MPERRLQRWFRALLTSGPLESGQRLAGALECHANIRTAPEEETEACSTPLN